MPKLQVILDSFLLNLEFQSQRKAKLYDGINRDMSVDTALRYLVEELGEVSQEITRDRLQSAMDECIDLAHCVFLLYLAIWKLKKNEVFITHIRSEDAETEISQ